MLYNILQWFGDKQYKNISLVILVTLYINNAVKFFHNVYRSHGLQSAFHTNSLLYDNKVNLTSLIKVQVSNSNLRSIVDNRIR